MTAGRDGIAQLIFPAQELIAFPYGNILCGLHMLVGMVVGLSGILPLLPFAAIGIVRYAVVEQLCLAALVVNHNLVSVLRLRLFPIVLGVNQICSVFRYISPVCTLINSGQRDQRRTLCIHTDV